MERIKSVLYSLHILGITIRMIRQRIINYSMVFLVGAMTLISCALEDNKTEIYSAKGKNGIVNIDLDSGIKFKLSEFVNKVDLIPLDNNIIINNSIPNQIIYFESKYFILPNKTAGVFVYDSIGKFIKRIGKIGRGPGELTVVTDIKVNEFDKRLYLLEPMGRIVTYDITSGQDLHTSRFSNDLVSVNSFIHLDKDKILLHSMSEPFHLSYFTPSTDRIYKVSMENIDLERKASFPIKNVFQLIDQKLLFYNYYEKVLYFVDQDTLNESIRFDFGDPGNLILGSIPERVNDYFDLMKYVDKTGKALIEEFVNQKSFVFFRVYYKGFARSIIYNKNSKVSGYLPYFYEYPKDMNSIPKVNGFNYFLGKNYNLVGCAISKEHLFKYIPKSLMSKSDIQKVEALPEDHNPILIRYHFKE